MSQVPASAARAALCTCAILLGSRLCAEGLTTVSPFAPAANAPAAAAEGDVQLSGISSIAGQTSVCLVDGARKSHWIPVGSSDAGMEVVSCSLAENTAVVRIHGEQRTLTLRAPSKSAGAKITPGQAAVPAPAPAQQALPQIPPPVQVASIEPAPPPPPPAGADTPPSDIGPAGGQLPPIIPLTTKEEQEREARMLVSDLMEIGMRQRKAYEEAQRRAKAEEAARQAQPGNTATATEKP